MTSPAPGHSELTQLLKRGGTGSDYKGYTVALFDGDSTVAQSSSQEPFKRFWEEDWKKKLEKK